MDSVVLFLAHFQIQQKIIACKTFNGINSFKKTCAYLANENRVGYVKLQNRKLRKVTERSNGTFGHLFRYMANPYRNCELTRDSLRNSQSKLDYAQGWYVYERTGYTGSCRGSGFSGSTSNDLECYDRYKLDHSFIGRAIVQEKSVRSKAECARECDRQRRRSIYDCQAFAYT